jgi:hypothetical protein
MAADASAASAEREGKRLQTGVEELDFELAIGDWLRLSDQLIHRCSTTMPLPPSSTSPP